MTPPNTEEAPAQSQAGDHRHPTAPQNSDSSETQASASAVLALLDWLWGDAEGVAVVATDRPEGGDFRNHPFRWPRQRADLAEDDEATATRNVWFAPMLYPEWGPGEERGPTHRRHARALPGRACYADLDHTDEWTDEQRDERAMWLRQLQAALVRSGTASNRHGYVKLNRPTDPDQIEYINRQLVALLDGDPSKVDCSSLLRLPGTLNHKTDPPNPVTLEYIDPDFEGWDPDELSAMLPEPAPKSLDEVREGRKRRRRATARAKAVNSTRQADSLDECDTKAACLNLPPDHHDRSSYPWVKKTAGYEARDAQDTTARSWAQYYAAMRSYDGASDAPYHDHDPGKFDEILEFVWDAESAKRAEVPTGQPTRELWRSDPEAYKATGKYEEEADKALLRTVATQEAATEQAAADWTAPTEGDGGSLADLLRKDRAKVQHRFDGLGKVGANTTIAAQYKTGKTTLVCNLARSLVDGEPFLGKFEVATALAGNLAIFNYELDGDEFVDWLEAQNIRNVGRIHVLNLRGKRMPLISDPVAEWITAWLRDRDIEAWIVDPAARAFSGCGDENSNQDVSVFTEALDVIKREAGVRDLWLPTHIGRGQEEGAERTRGATRWDDWPDVLWRLTKDKHDSRYFSAFGRKVSQPEIELSFDPVTGRLGTTGNGDRQSTQDAVWTTTAVKALRKILATEESCSKSKLGAALGNSKKQSEKAIDAAIRGGKIIATPQGNGKATLLTLPE